MLDERLAGLEIERFTKSTVRDVPELRTAIEGIRRNGYAIANEELEEGMRSIAAPIRDASGSVVAALNVAAPTSRISVAQLKRDILPLLLATIARIEADVRAPSARR